MNRYVHDIERKHIAYLKKRKEELIIGFIDACEEINAQIKEVKDGTWIKQVRGEVNADDSDRREN